MIALIKINWVPTHPRQSACWVCWYFYLIRTDFLVSQFHTWDICACWYFDLVRTDFLVSQFHTWDIRYMVGSPYDLVGWCTEIYLMYFLPLPWRRKGRRRRKHIICFTVNALAEKLYWHFNLVGGMVRKCDLKSPRVREWAPKIQYKTSNIMRIAKLLLGQRKVRLVFFSYNIS